jgi:DNA-binding phage protein
MSKRLTIAEQLRQAVRADGRGLARLSRDSGVAYAVLSRFMHGQRDITLRTAERVCKPLGIDLCSRTKGK